MAVALLDARGFRAEDFARSHPGGSLGRKLLIHVGDLMRTGDQLPVVHSKTAFVDMLHAMSSKGLGFVVVVDDVEPLGIFTDGDLRRLIERGDDLRGLHAAGVMRANPLRISPEMLAAEAASVMETRRVTSLLVVDEAYRLVGALSINDLLQAKVI